MSFGQKGRNNMSPAEIFYSLTNKESQFVKDGFRALFITSLAAFAIAGWFGFLAYYTNLTF